jgi:hypothetical protein
MEHKLHLLVARQASKAQRNLVNNKITKWLLMLTILFSSNYLYSQGNNWKLDGNNNANNASFLGTTNSFPLQFRTNNQNRFTIGSTGNYTFHTLSGNGNALMLLNNNGEAYRLNFSQNNNDVLTGNGIWQSINTLVPQYWQQTNSGLYTSQAVVVNNTITATGIQILHKIEADTIKGVRKVDINGNIILGEDGAYKGITAKIEDLNINSKPGYDFNTILNANTNGNVGIGTSNPTKKLDVNGDARISGTLWANTLEGNTVSTQQFITNQLQINDSIKVGLNSIWIGGADLSSYGYNNNAIYTTQDPLLLQNQYTSDNTLINTYSGRVGIGVENPSSKLEVWDPRIYGGTYINCNIPIATIKGVKGASNQCSNATVFAVELKPFIGITGSEEPLFAVNNNGYVGIGTNSPERNLHIKGNTPCVGPNCPVVIPNDPLPATTYLRIEDNITDINGNSVATNKWDLAVSGNQNRFFIQRVNANAEALTILNNNNIGVGTTNPVQKFHVNGKAVFEDNVGIGTTSPSEKLDVAGKIRACEVIVEQNNWCDYVFEPNYNLKSLDEVEQFIKQNKHLPNIPPAKEIAQNGIAISDMTQRMMEKIEELTLYVIQQQKEIEQLKQQLKKEGR